MPMSFSSEEDLITQVRPADGLILIEGKQRGVFLPSSGTHSTTHISPPIKRKAALYPKIIGHSLKVFRFITRGISSETIPTGLISGRQK